MVGFVRAMSLELAELCGALDKLSDKNWARVISNQVIGLQCSKADRRNIEPSFFENLDVGISPRLACATLLRATDRESVRIVAREIIGKTDEVCPIILRRALSD